MTNKATQHPVHLLDQLTALLLLKNDAALSRALAVAPPVISKIRHHKLRVTADMLLKMHDASQLSIADLRVLLYKSGTLA